jgi:hypothetical protein
MTAGVSLACGIGMQMYPGIHAKTSAALQQEFLPFCELDVAN